MKTFFKMNFLAIIFLSFSAAISTNPLPIWAVPYTEGIPKPGEMVLVSEKDIPGHIWVAGEYLKLGRFKGVISICNQVLSMKKDNIEAHAHLAAAYKGLGQEKEYRKEADLLKKLAPNSPTLHMSLAKTYLHLKDFDKAEASYKEGMKIASDKTEFLMELGVLYLENGRLNEASDQYLLVLKKKGLPVTHFINANFSLCKIGLQKKVYDEVNKRARMIIDLYPPIEQSYNFLAYAYIGKGEPRKAIEVYKLLKKNNPDSPIPYQEIPLIYVDKLNDNANARKVAQEGVGKFPNNAKSQDVLGWVLYKEEDFNKATEKFEKAHQLSPDNFSYIYHMGLAWQELGETGKALSMFKKALELVDIEKQAILVEELRKRIEQCQ